jgi:probable rRNA maturation factor
MTYEIDFSDDCRTSSTPLNIELLRSAVETGLKVEGVSSAVLSITLVDNATIHRINKDYLQHDYPTDVISFQLDWSHPDRISPGTMPAGRSDGAWIEGEIVASTEYALAESVVHEWSVQSELTLYVVHGMLHICGYDDLDPAEKIMMRARESAVLDRLGFSTVPRGTDDGSADKSTCPTDTILEPDE